MTDFQSSTSISNLLSALKDLGIHRLDTAARYPPLNPGRSEELIGEALRAGDGGGSGSGGFLIDTKVYTDLSGPGEGDLGMENVEESLKRSLGRMGRDEVGICFHSVMTCCQSVLLSPGFLSQVREMIIGRFFGRIFGLTR